MVCHISRDDPNSSESTASFQRAGQLKLLRETGFMKGEYDFSNAERENFLSCWCQDNLSHLLRCSHAEAAENVENTETLTFLTVFGAILRYFPLRDAQLPPGIGLFSSTRFGHPKTDHFPSPTMAELARLFREAGPSERGGACQDFSGFPCIRRPWNRRRAFLIGHMRMCVLRMQHFF